MLEHTLDDATTICMSRQAMHLPCECVDDELNMFGWDSFDRLLDNVVAILVLDAFKHMVFELFH